jgi:hypothetical protein
MQHKKKVSIQSIASSVLKVSTLNTQGNDFQDFYTLSVWRIKEALSKAYEAGKKAQTEENENEQ